MKKDRKITAIIIDDALQARELLFLMLGELAPEIQVLAQGENAEEAMELVKLHNPDVIFLDIEMPGMSGLDLVEKLLSLKLKVEIIFTTAYNEYAIRAFRLSAIDYLLKPLKEEQLIEAVQKLKHFTKLKTADLRLEKLSENLKIKDDNILCIPVNYGYEYLPVNSIEYIEADGSYSHIYMTDGSRKTVSKNLKFFETILKDFSFILKVHRSSILNIHHMVSYSKSHRGSIILKSGKQIEISRNHRTEVLDIILSYGK